MIYSMKTHRIVLLLIIIGVIGVAGNAALRRTNGSKPCFRCNVVIIMIDLLRADSLPCYGYRFNTAPALCAFAQKNIVFTRTFANSSWTLPSEFSIFTSVYPSNHGIGTTLKDVLDRKAVTMSELLQQNGYATTLVSNNQPSVGLKQGIERGFDSIIITPDSLEESLPGWLDAIDGIRASNAKRRPAFIFFHTDGVHDYADHVAQMGNVFPLDPDYRPMDIPAMQFTPELRSFTLSYLKEHILFQTGSATQEQYTTWHDQLLSAPTMWEAERIFNEIPLTDREYSYSHVIGPQLSRKNLDEYIPFLQHVYDEHIRRTDLYLKTVLERLEKNNLLRNTIVLISSEHGELLGENGSLGHGITMYNPLIHVPFILHIPQKKSARIEDLSQLIDVYPTIIDFLGIQPKTKLGGISLRGAIQQYPERLQYTYVISEWTNSWNAKAIQSTSKKLIEDVDRYGEDVHELYDLTMDPTEQNNIGPEQPHAVTGLSRMMNSIINSQQWYTPEPQPFPEWIDEEHRKKLIKTGYFNGP